MRRCSALILCLAAGMIASCTRTPDAPPKGGVADPKEKAAPVEKGPASPYCVLEHVLDRKIDDNTRLTIWDLRMQGLKKLTVQLLQVQDGKSTPVQGANHEWKEWPKDRPPAIGKVFYIMRTEKGKKFPSLSVEFNSDFSTSFHGRAVVNDAVMPLLDRDLKKENQYRSIRSLAGPLPKSFFLTTDASVPQKEQNPGWMGSIYAEDGTLKTLLERTEGGAALALSLEWTAE